MDDHRLATRYELKEKRLSIRLDCRVTQVNLNENSLIVAYYMHQSWHTCEPIDLSPHSRVIRQVRGSLNAVPKVR